MSTGSISLGLTDPSQPATDIREWAIYCDPIKNDLMSARHGVIVAYGVSGSGKTYSVNDYVKRWCSAMAESFAQTDDGGKRFEIALGAVELRMRDRSDLAIGVGSGATKKGENIVDLLAKGMTSHSTSNPLGPHSSSTALWLHRSLPLTIRFSPAIFGLCSRHRWLVGQLHDSS
jgi:hypothetical protein